MNRQSGHTSGRSNRFPPSCFLHSLPSLINTCWKQGWLPKWRERKNTEPDRHRGEWALTEPRSALHLAPRHSCHNRLGSSCFVGDARRDKHRVTSRLDGVSVTDPHHAVSLCARHRYPQPGLDFPLAYGYTYLPTGVACPASTLPIHYRVTHRVDYLAASRSLILRLRVRIHSQRRTKKSIILYFI